MSQPHLNELFAEYLRRYVAEPQSHQAVAESEVEPHQAATLTVTDARRALKDATAVANWLLDKKSAGAFQNLQMPPGWQNLVRDQESILAVPLCLGNYPQMLRDVGPLLVEDSPSVLVPQLVPSAAMTDVTAWGETMLQRGQHAESLLAAAVLRICSQHETAATLFSRIVTAAPKAWDALLRNEQAALAWSAGDRKRAAELWAVHPLADSPPILLNKGLVALVDGDLGKAKTLLSQAVAKLPDESAWHHLGQLYVTFASR